MGLTLLHDYPVGSDLGVGLHIKLIAAAYCTGTSAMSRGWGCPEEKATVSSSLPSLSLVTMILLLFDAEL